MRAVGTISIEREKSVHATTDPQKRTLVANFERNDNNDKYTYIETHIIIMHRPKFFVTRKHLQM